MYPIMWWSALYTISLEIQKNQVDNKLFCIMIDQIKAGRSYFKLGPLL